MPDAVFQEVVEAVSQRVAAAAVAAGSVYTVYRRRKAHVLESDVIPCVVVCPGSEGERIVFEAFGGQVVYGYSVTCLIASRGNEVLTPPIENPESAATTADGYTAAHMLMRETVRNAIYKRTLSGVSSVFNGEIVAGQPVVVTGGGGSLYLVSAMTVTHWSLETQTW